MDFMDIFATQLARYTVFKVYAHLSWDPVLIVIPDISDYFVLKSAMNIAKTMFALKTVAIALNV